MLKRSIAILALTAAAPATAQQVVTVVTVPTPAGVPRERIEAGMKASIPQYQKLPGLLRKYFTIGDGSFGGVYLWKDRASAEAWFNAAWHERAIKAYGRDGTITYFDVPLAIDGAAR